MSDAVRNVVLRVSLEHVNTTPKVNTEPAQKAMDDLEKKSKEAQEKIEAATKAAAEQAAKAGEQAISVGENLKTAGEGAFTLARGVAFLSSESDEDFKEMLENVAKVQGAFDLFKGSIEVIAGTTKALQAYRAASAAAAAADAARATATSAATAATAANTAATGTATIATKGLALATGPVGLALAGIATVSVFAYRELISKPRQATEEQKKFNEELERTSKRLREIAAQSNAERRSLSFNSQLERLDIATRRGRTPADTRQELQRMARESAAIIRESRRNLSTLPLVAVGRREDELKIIATELENQKRLQEEINDTHQDDLSLLNDELQKRQQIADQAARIFEQEQKRQSLAEELGRRTATERAELERLARLAKEGTITPAQLRRAEQLAPQNVGEFAGRQFAEIGEETLSRIGDSFAVEKSDAEQILEQAKRDVEGVRDTIEDQGKLVADQMREGWEAVEAILRDLLPIRDELLRLRADLDTREAQRGTNG